jgi:energy-coupling factor transporter ATP-binding protein EcfA2
MHLKTLHIKNFRALEDIQIELSEGVNVIVGPNAVGKTSVLEAIRLAKAILAPRTPSESSQALVSLGASVPYDPRILLIDAIARDPARPIEIRCRYELTASEVASLDAAIPEIVVNLVRTQMGHQFSHPTALTTFLSSTSGKTAITEAEKDVRNALDAIRRQNGVCRLDLTIDPSSFQMDSADPFAAMFVSFLDQRLPPGESIFTYFPADRALPSGDQPVQIGPADASNQVESHNSQPQLKYARLKNTIFGAVIIGEKARTELVNEFECIFNGILKGRRLVEVGVNRHGVLTVTVEDTETKRKFSLDGMSSGEKGLILTFLLISTSVTNGGLILLDEPELHLNPAVCKDLMSFLIDRYVKPKNLQAIVCSHSPEILAGVFDNDYCSLYHLMSENLCTKVRRNDPDVVSEALRKLGTSETEGLLYKATIFVEGAEDIELLEAGFSELLRRHKLKDLGGRREVEKQIRLLQDAEKQSLKITPKYFIFDRDDKPSDVKDSQSVGILQWDRRCLENYLIDIDVVTDVLKDPDVVQSPFANQGEVVKLLRELAMSQLDDSVAASVYAGYHLENPGIRQSEIQGKNINEVANAIFNRLDKIKNQVTALPNVEWKQRFLDDVQAKRRELEPTWEAKWREDCDGKRLFRDLHLRRPFKVSLRRLKKEVMYRMRGQRTETWRSVESLLKRLVDGGGNP